MIVTCVVVIADFFSFGKYNISKGLKAFYRLRSSG